MSLLRSRVCSLTVRKLPTSLISRFMVDSWLPGSSVPRGPASPLALTADSLWSVEGGVGWGGQRLLGLGGRRLLASLLLTGFPMSVFMLSFTYLPILLLFALHFCPMVRVAITFSFPGSPPEHLSSALPWSSAKSPLGKGCVGRHSQSK